MTDLFANPRTAASLCLGNNGTRALGNASLNALIVKERQAGSECPQGKHIAVLKTSAPLPNRQHKDVCIPHPLNNTGRVWTHILKSFLLLARHFWAIKYWPTTLNKTRRVSHRALVKTEKASDSFVWSGFIVSLVFVTSPALTSHYTWSDFTVLKTYQAKSSPKPQIDATEFPWKGSNDFLYIKIEVVTFFKPSVVDWMEADLNPL